MWDDQIQNAKSKIQNCNPRVVVVFRDRIYTLSSANIEFYFT